MGPRNLFYKPSKWLRGLSGDYLIPEACALLVVWTRLFYNPIRIDKRLVVEKLIIMQVFLLYRNANEFCPKNDALVFKKKTTPFQFIAL